LPTGDSRYSCQAARGLSTMKVDDAPMPFWRAYFAAPVDLPAQARNSQSALGIVLPRRR
jgi:hypothetical protein